MIYKKTKIICTIGPSVSDVKKTSELIEAGMDAARLNFSHGTHEHHQEYIDNIISACEKTGKMVAIIQDLSGPKIRIGKLKDKTAELIEGNNIKITSKDIEGTAELVSTNYPHIIHDLDKNASVLIDDGNLRLKVLSDKPENDEIECEIMVGGTLKENKGINLPETNIKLPSLTEKDKIDLDFGLKNGVDFVAMSFVRSADDIKLLRELISSKGKMIPIIAKIERREAIDDIDHIIDEADLVMVARGDLGVEISTEEVPLLQKMIIRKCNDKIKPVITATQMLESMIESPVPTRAEASDISNAILDGTDCVMLSAETSTGKYPTEVVQTMKKIILKTETIKKSSYFKELFVEDSPENTLHTICNSASEIAARLNAKAIIAITHTGKSPLLLSNHRPNAQIISVSHTKSLVRYFKLIWGVESLLIGDSVDYTDIVELIKEKIISNNILNPGDRIVIVSSMPLSESESANNIEVTQV